MTHRDQLQRFILENTSIRGQLVHLDASWQAVIDKHAYPEPVRNLLGEAITASVLLSSILKFEGSLTLQTHSEGPVTLLLAQITSNRTFRGLAKWSASTEHKLSAGLLHNGRMVITVEPKFGKERYQSIVSINEGALAGTLAKYFEQSEQLRTRLWLAANGQQAAGLLLQELPLASGENFADPEVWNHALTLTSSLSHNELLQLPADEVLRRLYFEQDVRLFEPETVSFRCTCSRGRIEAALRALGYVELQDTLREQGKVEVNCEFCNRHYIFDKVDIKALFRRAFPPQGVSTRH